MSKLTYHKPSPDDFDALLAMASDWHVVRQLGRWSWPPNQDQIRSFCEPFEGDGFVWTIKEEGQFAGRIGITGGSIGYTLPRHAQGRGIGTAASRYAITQAFDLLDLDVITGTTWADNPASYRVLQKLGFQHWHSYFQRSYARGFPVMAHLHRLTRPAWDRLNAQPQ